MSMKIKQLISATLTMIMIFSLFSGNIVHAANVEATLYKLPSPSSHIVTLASHIGQINSSALMSTL